MDPPLPAHTLISSGDAPYSLAKEATGTEVDRHMDWKQPLVYIIGTVDQELLLCNAYLVTENCILRNQLQDRVSCPEGIKIYSSSNSWENRKF
jgi:hypothetical protein